MQDNYLTYYSLLGIETNATDEQIKSAWKIKMKEYHSDLNGGHKAADELSKQFNHAKEILLNAQKRLQYDYLIGVKKKPQSATNSSSSSSANNNSAGVLIGAAAIGLIIGLCLGNND